MTNPPEKTSDKPPEKPVEPVVEDQEYDLPFIHGSVQEKVARDIIRGHRELSYEDRRRIELENHLNSKQLSGILTDLRRLKLYEDAYSRGEKIPASKIQELQNTQGKAAALVANANTETLKQQNARVTHLEEDLSSMKSLVVGQSEKLDTMTKMLNSVLRMAAVAGPDDDNAETEDSPALPVDPHHDGEEEKAEKKDPENLDDEPPTMIPIGDASMKQIGTWVYAKNMIFYDFAKQHVIPGVLEKFDGNWSDFVNVVIEDYFKQKGLGVGLLSRRFA